MPRDNRMLLSERQAWKAFSRKEKVICLLIAAAMIAIGLAIGAVL
jgi:hypothetical protein